MGVWCVDVARKHVTGLLVCLVMVRAHPPLMLLAGHDGQEPTAEAALTSCPVQHSIPPPTPFPPGRGRAHGRNTAYPRRPDHLRHERPHGRGSRRPEGCWQAHHVRRATPRDVPGAAGCERSRVERPESRSDFERRTLGALHARGGRRAVARPGRRGSRSARVLLARAGREAE
eukprot:3508941-Prymnesium_polylepis.1